MERCAWGCAVAADSVTDTGFALFGLPLIRIYEFLGTLFLNALKMLIVPLIVSSIIAGIAGIGNVSGFGRLGLLRS